MAHDIRAYRIFIASPGGLERERKAFRNAIQAYNEAEAMHRGVLFIPVGWEDTLGGIGRPQSIINADIRSCDFMVLLFGNRWGSPPDYSGEFSSATEEEFSVALECARDPELPMRQIVVFFRAPTARQLSAPDRQLARVLEFRKSLERSKEHLFHVFDVTSKFTQLLTRHLAAWVRTHEQGDTLTGAVAADPVPSCEPTAVSLLGLDSTSFDPDIIEAWRLADSGRRTEAEELFARASVRMDKPRSICEYGRFLERDGRLEQAMVMYERARDLARALDDSATLAETLRRIGNVRLTRGDMAGAEAIYRESLDVCRDIAQDEGTAAVLGNLGALLYTRGDLDAAEAMYKNALAVNQRINRPEGIAKNYSGLGMILERRGDLAAAEAMHWKALEVDGKNRRLEGMANDYSNLGIILANRGDLDAAEGMHRKALEINEQLGRLEEMANGYGNLGIVLGTRGDFDAAETMYQKSLEIDRRLGRPRGIAITSRQLGYIELQRGNLKTAHEHLERSASTFEALGMQDEAKEVQDRLARVRTHGARSGTRSDHGEFTGRVRSGYSLHVENRRK